jgi:hypothetical protein
LHNKGPITNIFIAEGHYFDALRDLTPECLRIKKSAHPHKQILRRGGRRRGDGERTKKANKNYM